MLTSFRPVSDLTYLSKLLERLAAKQLIRYTESTGMMECNQSAYHENHSTETCLLKLKTDILDAINKKEVMCLVLLDLSAAFDSLEHSLILNRLKYQFGIVSKCLDWFKDYLSNRTQCITVCNSTGNIVELEQMHFKAGNTPRKCSWTTNFQLVPVSTWEKSVMHMASIFQDMQMTAKIISALDLLRTTSHHNITALNVWRDT